MDLDKAKVWETLPEAATVAINWAAFQDAIKKLYLGCESTIHYC